ncbi:MAG: hypothetical protein LBL78_03105, partial [Prevotellaceae bacterium]|nr:hypothetical protein [Prevotellaceae bacterium]
QLAQEEALEEPVIADFAYKTWGNLFAASVLETKFGTAFAADPRQVYDGYKEIPFDLIARYRGVKGSLIRRLFAGGNIRLIRLLCRLELFINHRKYKHWNV